MHCPCCKANLSNKKVYDVHIYAFHPEYKEPIQPKIGRKYQRIVSSIEKCFYQYQKSNIQVLTLSEIRNWFLDNTSNGLSKQRLSNFLRRRPQFVLHKKARLRNTNQIETWWSLGDIPEDTEIEESSLYIDIPIN